MKRFYKQGIYHVFNKSIANYGIFKDEVQAQRFYDTLYYYNNQSHPLSFSTWLRRNEKFIPQNLIQLNNEIVVKFIAFCIMPDHYHLLVKILENNFSKYISDVENSFTRYFNLKFDRKGPLWQSSFKSVRIKNNEQLLHITRYIHLNPTTAGLVEKPEYWIFSSYKSYTSDEKILDEVITEVSIKNIQTYRKFVENRIDYQKKLRLMKKLALE